MYLVIFLSFIMAVVLIFTAGCAKNEKKEIATPELDEAQAVPEEIADIIDTEAYDWPASTPEEQGLDSSVLKNAFIEAEKMPYMYSLLVIRNGYLVAEQYFHGQNRNRANDIHSASKSFTSALIGIAFEKGYLKSLDQKMMNFFPEYVTPALDPRIFDITIEHLLMMQGGFDWDDDFESWDEYGSAEDWIKYTLKLPFKSDPGERFDYCTPQTNLLSAILTRATGMNTKEFAEKYLFESLGISIGCWHTYPPGYYTGGHAMCFNPRNMARLGYLYLNKGKVDGIQIVPEEWVEASVKSYGSSPWNWGAVKEHGYGYQWWNGKLGGYSMFYASGKGGQFIIVIPQLEMVVVTTTDATAWGKAEWEQILATMQFVADNVLSAVMDSRDRSLSKNLFLVT